jgi:GTPase SAR1 family protein
MASKKEKGKGKMIRICVLGSSFTGKSALVNRFVNNSFEWVYEPTNEPNIFRRLINITDDEEHKQYCMMQIEDLFPINHPMLQVGDSESEESPLIKYYDQVLGNKRSEKKKPNDKPLFKETIIHGYMYVYDVTSKASFDEVCKVIEYIHTREEKEAGKKKSGKAAKILVGTKIDCLASHEINSKVESFKKKYGLLSRKVSALTNSEIKEAFLDLARNALDSNVQDGEVSSDDEEEGGGFFSFFGCASRDKGDEEDESRCEIV